MKGNSRARLTVLQLCALVRLLWDDPLLCMRIMLVHLQPASTCAHRSALHYHAGTHTPHYTYTHAQ